MPNLSCATITHKPDWETFIQTRPEANFLQSWSYGECYEQLGNVIFRLGFYKNHHLAGIAFGVKETAKRGTYLSFAGGPILDWNDEALLEFALTTLKTLGQQEGAVFVRLRPQIEAIPTFLQRLHKKGWSQAPVNLEAQHTLILDLSQPPESLLAQMKKNHRYEIRKAQKLEIKTTLTTDQAALKNFCHYHQWLGKKHGYTPFAQSFLTTQFKAFQPDDQVFLIQAHQGKKLLAAAYVLFYNQEAAYHYGISTPDNTGLPGAYACQWRVIEEAQKRAMQVYNLWGGLVPIGAKNHRYRGVDTFKRGFGGKEIYYLPAHDLPLSWRYWGIYVFEKLRRKLRKL